MENLMERQNAFTMIELLVTVAIAAILMSIALPGFAELIRNVRASGDVTALTSALSVARSEAVKRNQNVCMLSADWGLGWEVRIDSNGDGSCSGLLIRKFEGIANSASLTITPDEDIIFDGVGRRVGANDYLIEYRSDATASCNERRDRNLTIGSSGRTKIEACQP